MNPIPTMNRFFAMLGFNLFGFILNAINTFDPGGPFPWFVSASFATASAVCLGFCPGVHRKAVKARQEWRNERYRRWLNEPLPEPVEESWEDIERAIKVLISSKVEPTYEIAQKYLKLEREEDLNIRSRILVLKRRPRDRSDWRGFDG